MTVPALAAASVSSAALVALTVPSAKPVALVAAAIVLASKTVAIAAVRWCARREAKPLGGRDERGGFGGERRKTFSRDR